MNGNKYSNAWNKRNVDFRNIHGDESGAFEALINNIPQREGIVIADLMSGYGSVSKFLLENAKQRNIYINILMLDNSSSQLLKSLEYLKDYEASSNISRIIKDLRIPFKKRKFLDLAIMKMGLHEVREIDQLKVLDNIYDSLKKDGEFYIWESYGLSEEINLYFNKIIRKKDELAGFTSMVENRYFPNKERILEMLTNSGFKDLRQIYEGEFEYPTYRLLPDLKSKDLLEIWNQYIRDLLPEKARRLVNYNDQGNYIDLRFTKGIFYARK